MPGGYSIIPYRHRGIAGLAIILVFMACGGILSRANAVPAEPVLQLTPDKNRYFLGPYLAYLEDPQKKLTIDDVSSPQMTTRFVKHAGKMINLGLDSSAYWIRFTVDAFQVQVSQKKLVIETDLPQEYKRLRKIIARANVFKEAEQVLPRKNYWEKFL